MPTQRGRLSLLMALGVALAAGGCKKNAPPGCVVLRARPASSSGTAAARALLVAPWSAPRAPLMRRSDWSSRCPLSESRRELMG
jgi:hypothetical protein